MNRFFYVSSKPYVYLFHLRDGFNSIDFLCTHELSMIIGFKKILQCLNWDILACF